MIYLAHRIQQPILKLQNLNFHNDLDQLEQILLFVIAFYVKKILLVNKFAKI